MDSGPAFRLAAIDTWLIRRLSSVALSKNARRRKAGIVVFASLPSSRTPPSDPKPEGGTYLRRHVMVESAGLTAV